MCHRHAKTFPIVYTYSWNAQVDQACHCNDMRRITKRMFSKCVAAMLLPCIALLFVRKDSTTVLQCVGTDQHVDALAAVILLV